MEDGGHGEFTVLVNGQRVARKGDAMLTVEEVVTAVRNAQPAATAST
jgi:hypothetical protein